MYMRKNLMKTVALIALMLMALDVSAQTKQEKAAQDLAQRLLPNHYAEFIFVEKPAKGDYYEVRSVGDKIEIKGNNSNSMAMGLNHYLRKYCLATVSWYRDMPLNIPTQLKKVDGVERGEAKVNDRFFLNYCTYGYTMPFWNWADWEHFIDWMALNGVNMPLAITGQEAVWYNVWKTLGMNDAEIRSYFTGPTYLPWHRMANIDNWNGPLPKEWLDGQIELQKKILSRERELAMRPVLPAFAGHVPVALKNLFPDADIQSLGTWAGFNQQYSCHFLNPEDHLFAKIQKLFLEEQTRLFGTDHIYGVDPFNEVKPPSWEPEYLKKVSKNMYKTLTAVDKDAIWLQMTWMFYYKRKNWTDPRIEALLTGVPKGKMYLLDYHCENTELWKTTKKFHGQPYIWCYLGNFGGNTTITGNVKESGERLANTINNGGKNFIGIGSTLEGLDIEQFPYEYIFEKAWTTGDCSDDLWIENLADRHYGAKNESVREAWKILFNEIYKQVPRTLGVLSNYRPVFDQTESKSRTTINYSQNRLVDAWRLMLQADNAENEAFVVDLVVVGRQVLGNYFKVLKGEFDKAYHAKDIPLMKQKATEIDELLQDMDMLTAAHPYSSLQMWIAKAREMGSNQEVSNYYEKNARNLITTWGGRLNDYASRTWNGLISDYYVQRWNLYIDMMLDSAKTGKPFDNEKYEVAAKTVEQDWVNSTNDIRYARCYDVLNFSRGLSQKYADKLLNSDK